MLSLPDAQWLVSDDQAPLIRDTVARFDDKVELIQIVKSLRKQHSPETAKRIAELAQLRIRGRRKFNLADKMFFTTAALEMATDEKLAAYKAKRFQNFENVVDVCCSIGGDLFGLARRNSENPELTRATVGIDLDPVAVIFANANLKAMGLPHLAAVQDFANLSLEQYDAVHIDPERRQQGRSTFGDKFVPALDSIFEKLNRRVPAAIKVAPATGLKSFYPDGIQRQWIGHSRECKQQIIWTGELATSKNCHVATVIADGEDVEFSRPMEEVNSCRCGRADQIGDFVYEPHNTVLAAKLTDSLANEHDLCRIENDIAYLTGSQLLNTPLLQSFQVLECVPGDIKKITESINRHRLKNLEIKNRGVEESFVNQVRKIRSTDGERPGTIVLTQFKGNHCAILAVRPPAI